jgi:hypothetical protein
MKELFFFGPLNFKLTRFYCKMELVFDVHLVDFSVQSTVSA